MNPITSLLQALKGTGKASLEENACVSIEPALKDYYAMRDKHEKALATRHYDDPDSAIARRADAFSQMTIHYLDKIGASLEKASDIYTKLTKKFHHATFKKNALACVSGIAGGIAALFLLRGLSVIPCSLGALGTTAISAIGGGLIGNNQWVKPVHKEYEHFKSAVSAEMLALQNEGKEIEKAGKREMTRLTAELEKTQTPLSSKSHVNALENQRQDYGTVIR